MLHEMQDELYDEAAGNAGEGVYPGRLAQNRWLESPLLRSLLTYIKK